MARRPFIFRHGRKEVILPVTPSSFWYGKSNNMEIINLHELGDVSVAGNSGLVALQIDCLYPAADYSFSRDNDPETYMRIFDKWRDEKTVVRFIIGNTNVNLPVKIKGHYYGEGKDGDGTNDVYAQILLNEHIELPKPKFEKTGKGQEQKSRPDMEKEKKTSSYTVKPGDCLSAITWALYGSAAPDTWNKLAQINTIPNPHLIYPGQVLKIPHPLE